VFPDSDTEVCVNKTEWVILSGQFHAALSIRWRWTGVSCCCCILAVALRTHTHTHTHTHTSSASTDRSLTSDAQRSASHTAILARVGEALDPQAWRRRSDPRNSTTLHHHSSTLTNFQSGCGECVWVLKLPKTHTHSVQHFCWNWPRRRTCSSLLYWVCSAVMGCNGRKEHLQRRKVLVNRIRPNHLTITHSWEYSCRSVR